MYKKRVILNFSPEITDKPITYSLIKKYDVIVNILQAKIFPEEEGQLILELQNERKTHLEDGIQYLKNEGVKVRILDESIKCDDEKCINCGACTGVCKTGALTMDPETWELVVDQDKCLICEMCVSVCPVKALTLDN